MTPAPKANLPLSYEDAAALSNDGTFRGRVMMACLHFADYISNEAPNVPAHNTRFKWAQETMNNPDMAAAKIQKPVCNDPQVVTDGAGITDAKLQTVVETTINKLL